MDFQVAVCVMIAVFLGYVVMSDAGWFTSPKDEALQCMSDHGYVPGQAIKPNLKAGDCRREMSRWVQAQGARKVATSLLPDAPDFTLSILQAKIEKEFGQ